MKRDLTDGCNLASVYHRHREDPALQLPPLSSLLLWLWAVTLSSPCHDLGTCLSSRHSTQLQGLEHRIGNHPGLLSYRAEAAARSPEEPASSSDWQSVWMP